MTRQVMSRLAVVAGGVLMVAYFLLNAYKLDIAVGRWSEMAAGNSAVTVQIMLNNELLGEKTIKSSEIFDAEGQHQVSFVSLPESVIDRLRSHPEAASVLLGSERLPLVSSLQNPYLYAMNADRKVYLLVDNELEKLMLVVQGEHQRGRNLVSCVTKGLCQTLKISSQDWFVVTGPYLDTELRPDLRGMPRGRWVKRPQTALTVHSDKRQKVSMLVDLLGFLPNQKIVFQGQAVIKMLQAKGKEQQVSAGGRQFQTKYYIVNLDLQAGDNELVMQYSTWQQPAGKDTVPLAAYLTGITIKSIN